MSQRESHYPARDGIGVATVGREIGSGPSMGTKVEMVRVVGPIFRRGGLISLREGKLEEIRVELSHGTICSINIQAVKASGYWRGHV